MTLTDLLRETIDLPEQDVWENERTPRFVRVFEMRLHSVGLSLREVVAVLDLLEIDRSHEAVSNWKHDLAETQLDPPTVPLAEPVQISLQPTATQSSSRRTNTCRGSAQLYSAA